MQEAPAETPVEEPAAQGRTEVVVRTSADEPVAGILMRAETHEDLTVMLSSLHRAIEEEKTRQKTTPDPVA